MAVVSRVSDRSKKDFPMQAGVKMETADPVSTRKGCFEAEGRDAVIDRVRSGLTAAINCVGSFPCVVLEMKSVKKDEKKVLQLLFLSWASGTKACNDVHCGRIGCDSRTLSYEMKIKLGEIAQMESDEN